MLDAVTRGTWLINSYKHLLGVRPDAPELGSFEATEVAGKAGSLLARLVADETETVPAARVQVFARQSGIRVVELRPILRYLRDAGKVDFLKGEPDQSPSVEVYSFSTQDALATTSAIYGTLDSSPPEQASLVSLDATFRLPHSTDELMRFMTEEGFSEEEAELTLHLQEVLTLVRVAREDDLSEPLYYNEHAFSGNPGRIAKALKGLTDTEHQQVTEVLDRVEKRPGYPLSALSEYPSKVLRLMEGVGLLDSTEVRSEHADEVFITSPQLKGIAIDAAPLSADVFHKAKVLLASLRFGELKSRRWRGAITTQEKMLNIINKLLRGDWVGPCTAIGQDYRMLEVDGVVATRPATEGWQSQYDMYLMRLRQREVGVLAKQMIEYGRVVPEANPDLSSVLAQEPVIAYEIPEKRRAKILAKQTAPVKEIRDRIFQTMRSGLKDTL